jgi:hypothetical protein
MICTLVSGSVLAQQASNQQPAYKQNTIKLFTGIGPKGISTQGTANQVVIQQKYKTLFGIGYQRQLHELFSIDAIGLNNNTFLVGAGFSY